MCRQVARDAAVAHQPGHLVRRLRRQGPEVPLHVVIAQVVVRAPLLRADEVLELQRVADEEDRGVVPDHVVVALGGVELQREAARVPPGVGAAPLPGHGGEPDQRVGPGAWLEHRGLGVGADVLRHLEVAERAAALGVRLTLGDALAVEVGHLLDQVVILEQDRAVGADGERMLVTLDRRTGIGRRRLGAVLLSLPFLLVILRSGWRSHPPLDRPGIGPRRPLPPHRLRIHAHRPVPGTAAPPPRNRHPRSGRTRQTRW